MIKNTIALRQALRHYRRTQRGWGVAYLIAHQLHIPQELHDTTQHYAISHDPYWIGKTAALFEILKSKRHVSQTKSPTQ